MEITDEYNACHEKNISSIIYPGHSKPPLGPFVVVEPGVVVDGDVVVSVGVTVVDETVVFVVTEPAFYKQKLTRICILPPPLAEEFYVFVCFNILLIKNVV